LVTALVDSRLVIRDAATWNEMNHIARRSLASEMPPASPQQQQPQQQWRRRRRRGLKGQAENGTRAIKMASEIVRQYNVYSIGSVAGQKCRRPRQNCTSQSITRSAPLTLATTAV